MGLGGNHNCGLCRGAGHLLLLHSSVLQETTVKGREKRYEGGGPEVRAAAGIGLQGKGTVLCVETFDRNTFTRDDPIYVKLCQVQPDMEELTENAEEPDEGESKQSEQKLGKLQYKVTPLQ